MFRLTIFGYPSGTIFFFTCILFSQAMERRAVPLSFCMEVIITNAEKCFFISFLSHFFFPFHTCVGLL